MPLEFRGVHADFFNDWSTPELDLEGSLASGKTTVGLWKELEALKRWPGIWILLARWTEDSVKTLLRPAFEQLARIHGTTWNWNDKLNFYEFENGSRAYAFGLKTQSQDPEQRYGKLRGLSVSRIYIDQAEQLPADVAAELRARLRPDIEARMKGTVFPMQLTITPNPPSESSWIAKQFPITNTVKGRRYLHVSLYANKHNLPEETIESLLRQYPPEHPKNSTVIMGERGLNVIGEAIFENLFDRKIHVRAVEPTIDAPLLEAFEFGKHNPVWLVAQRTYHGGIQLLGGILGRRLVLEDFLPLVKQHRAEWFDPKHTWKTCTAPMGETVGRERYTLLNVLREAGFKPVWRENTNAHDVQLAMIEQIAGLLRRRTALREEALAINADPMRWFTASHDGTLKSVPFLAFAFEGGYVWDPHFVSVSNKEMRQPFEDDEYANAMHCVQSLLLNFAAGQGSEADTDLKRQQAREQALKGGSVMQHAGPGGWMAF